MLEASEDKFLGETVNNPPPSTAGKSKLGVVLGAVTGGAALALTAVCAPFVLPALRRVCLPYVPATDNQVSNVLKALKGRSGNFIDLGSGDGRIVLAAARNGFQATGVELNPWLVLYSRILSYKEVRRGNVPKHLHPSFLRADLWKLDLRMYPNVVIFGVQEMMPDLEEKLKKELCDGGAVVACRFPFPNSSPDIVIGSGIDTVWLYYKKNEAEDLKCDKSSYEE